MKIVYLVPTRVVSSRNSVQYQRVKHLSEKNDLFLIAPKNSPIPEEIEARAIVKRSNFIAGFFYLLWLVYKTWKMDREVHFDFVYTLHPAIYIVEGFFLKLLGFRWIVDIWDHPELSLAMGTGNYLKESSKKLLLQFARRFLRHADLVICAIVPQALQDYNVEPKKFLPVTNGVELEYVKPKGETESSHEFKIFYVGYIMLKRGMDTLLKAANELKGKLPFKLYIVGVVEKEEDIERVKNFIAEKELGGHTEIRCGSSLGAHVPHDEVFKLMEKSDVCVYPFPRTTETDYIYPVKVFEYLAMAKPVVATNLKGVSQIINHGENGLLVEPDDPEAMAKAILMIYQDEELRRRLQLNARRSILQYDWGIINKKIDNALNDLRERVKIGK